MCNLRIREPRKCPKKSELGFAVLGRFGDKVAIAMLNHFFKGA